MSDHFFVDKTDQDNEREQSLVAQWVHLTEERNAVMFPQSGSGIPGAPPPTVWTSPSGMEPYIPVLFLDLNGKLFFHINKYYAIPLFLYV